MRTTAYLKAIMEVYGKTFTDLGSKQNQYQACFVGYLGCYVCDLLYDLMLCFDFSKSYNDFN